MKEAIIAFELTMPNNNAWNGVWSGAQNRHIRFRKFGRSRLAHAKVKDLLKNPSHYYNFGDGWGANVTMFEVDTKERNKLAKESAGFCGYDWMIDSILKFGKITTDQKDTK